MTELDLIVKYLERRGTKVVDYMYYDQGIFCNAGSFSVNLAAAEGLAVEKTYFFGHVSIATWINGVILLTNQNLLNIQLKTVLLGRSEVAYLGYVFGVNCNMSLIGDGTYNGLRRYYGVGCNQVLIDKMGFGAATFEVRLAFNGYLFMMK